MRTFIIFTSILLLFLGVFGTALSHSPVEIKSIPVITDEWKLVLLNGQNHISIKEIDSLSAFSNKGLSLALMGK